VAFASFFPDLVSSLVLIAPSGLIRTRHISARSRVIYSQNLIPESILTAAVRRRLKTQLYPSKPSDDDEPRPDVTAPVASEMPKIESSPSVIISKSHPDITIDKAVSWQVDHHDGFVQAFMSSIRHGPITNQHEYWRIVGRRLTERKSNSSRLGMHKNKVLIISGKNDGIIMRDEIIEDATDVLQGNVEFKFVDAGHEAPVAKAGEVVKIVSDFWELDQRDHQSYP